MKIGTRGSTMALAQTREVVRLLNRAHPGLAAQEVKFTPTGDRDQTSKLERHGGKGGAFVAELRAAMLGGELDCCMHSLKDMPGDEETPGLVIGAYLKREAAADAIVLPIGVDAATAIDRERLAGKKIGTNSVRRAAYLRRLYPRAEIIHFRGAADTRIDKLDNRTPQKLPDGGTVGPADALVMAASGLKRIGREERISRALSIGEMLPCVGQGIVAVECPASAWKTRELLAAIDDAETRAMAEAEREMLWVLNGHCNAPIAGHATIDVARMTLKGAVISLDGKTLIEIEADGAIDRPKELGRAVGLQLLAHGAKEIIDATRD
ncbi:MAG: hydroxymethylbilane synthase [Alphaproteobacteria bacterium RIFCSPHIGHO2_12_FULL_63_12]|nr:MAG: hydroxymethylbilane synthase [Alphaproteobacteria bacterium RIFCSPHIGHO2_12_FULL_63_12]